MGADQLFETFAREAEAGLGRIILLVLDNGGWHGAAGLEIPDGIRLVYLPPYSPELHPAQIHTRTGFHWWQKRIIPN
jgi:transposase